MNYPLHVFAFFLLVWIAFQFWVLREPEKERDSDNLSRLHQRLTETVLLMNKVRADNAELDVQIEHLKYFFIIFITTPSAKKQPRVLSPF
jgi:hypothetical protein